MKISKTICIGLWAVGLASGARASTIHAVNRHAYGANVGWFDARADGTNGAVIGQLHCTGHLWGANVGWIGLGSGAPANGHAYANDSSADWGVNHDGTGGLRGNAYGANVGWIAFEDTGDPRVDLLTGALSGHVWSANVGWISLANSQAFVQTDSLDWGPDSDGDGIPDAWEMRRAGDLTTLGAHSADHDNDGSPDVDEFRADTDPDDDASFFAVTAYARVGPTNTLTWTVAPTRLYRLETSPAMTNGAAWSDSGHGLLAPGSGPVQTRAIVDPSPSGTRFHRARAVVPLTP